MYRMKAFCPECNNVTELLEDHCYSCDEIFANDELNKNGNCENCQKKINKEHQDYLSSVRADYKNSTKL